MSELYFVITITPREYREEFIEFYKERGINLVISTLGQGTATESILDYLGLENTRKSILFGVTTDAVAARFMRKVLTKMRIDAPGRGVSFSLPVSSVGGGMTLKYLTEHEHEHETDKNVNAQSEAHMRENDFELIIAITEGGHTDMVMDAARSAGAFGGTTVHAKGCGSEYASKFFGISIAEEKEMIFIVVRKEIKSAVMKAIMTNAGVQSKAHTIVFSLPVMDVAGMHVSSEDDE